MCLFVWCLHYNRSSTEVFIHFLCLYEYCVMFVCCNCFTHVCSCNKVLMSIDQCLWQCNSFPCIEGWVLMIPCMWERYYVCAACGGCIWDFTIFFPFSAPGAPRNLNLRARSPTELRASWLAPDERNNNGVILGYRLTLRDLQSQESSVVTTTSVTYTWSGLHPYYSYSVSIAAATSAGHGPGLNARIEMPEAGEFVDQKNYD